MFKKAQSLHQQGKLDEAAIVYRKILAQNPKNFDVLNLLGVIEFQRKNPSAALGLIDRAIKIRPDAAGSLSNRGLVLHDLKRLDDALASYDRALTLEPHNAKTHYNRGVTLQELKRLEDALASYDRALALQPAFAEALNNRAAVLQGLKRFDDALACCDVALSLKPDYAGAHYNRGFALHQLKRLDEALASYDRALALQPEYAEALMNRGCMLQALKRLDEALASYDRALSLKPDYAGAHFNRGSVLHELKRLDDALASYDRALALQPDDADARMNRGIAKLLRGNYRDGWADYEWRWEAKDASGKPLKIDARDWRGEELDGRSILIFHEQGLGDIIQFARYLPLLVQRRARVSFLGPEKVNRLLGSLSAQIEFISAPEVAASFDFRCPLMSLPLRFCTDALSIPNEVPYLRAEADRVSRWKTRIGEHGFKVGIAWQGSPKGKVDQGRSIPLAEFAPLSRLSGLRLISLQKHHGLDQLARFATDAGIEVLGEDLDNGPDAFADTAAVMSNLDLIISSDTSIAHLAGALARPTWLALKYVPEWRWLLDREDSPWYPTMRLFRQQTPEDWRSVFGEMVAQLNKLLATKPTRNLQYKV